MRDNSIKLTCCDSECARANGCYHLGGIRCEGCGRYFCPNEIDENGYCCECSDASNKNNEEE